MPRINLLSRGLVPLSFLILTPVVRAQDAVPAPFEKSRYESLRTKSPFAVATAVAPVVQGPTFAANWYITGAARIGDMNFVTIKSRDLSTQFSLYGDEPVDGVVLASVTWSDAIGKSTAVLRKGSETARLEFNEAQLRNPAPAAAGASPAPGAANHPAGVNGAVNSPRPVGANMAPPNNAAPAPNGNGLPRRRVLPIPVPK